jgi:hypothetical protein
VPDAALGTIDNATLANDDITVAGNVVSLGGSTSVDHADLSNIAADDHHAKYTDAEAVSAVNAETTLSVDISGDADTVDGIEAADLGFKFDGQIVSSNHTASQGENVFVDANSSAVTVTLPPPSTDLVVNVKKIDSSDNDVTVSPNSTETIDDQANIIISSEYASLTFASDGTDYYII